MQQTWSSKLEQTESNIVNLAELIRGAESLLRTRIQQEGSASPAVQQLQQSIATAKEKYTQTLDIHAKIKKYVTVGYPQVMIRFVNSLSLSVWTGPREKEGCKTLYVNQRRAGKMECHNCQSESI